MIREMKKEDRFFKELYTEIFYGGSYYDGLKVGEPEEYDLDVLFKLPRLTSPQITTDLDGYVKVKLDLKELHNQNKLEMHK